MLIVMFLAFPFCFFFILQYNRVQFLFVPYCLGYKNTLCECVFVPCNHQLGQPFRQPYSVIQWHVASCQQRVLFFSYTFFLLLPSAVLLTICHLQKITSFIYYASSSGKTASSSPHSAHVSLGNSSVRPIVNC